MRNDEIFDSRGIDGLDNKKAWDKFPKILKYFISSTQKMIYDKIERNIVEHYGKDRLKDLVKTSGFRSIPTNNRVGGVVDSLHLFGCAIDFAKVGFFKNNPIPVCCELECLDSGSCWHVQMKRGER